VDAWPHQTRAVTLTLDAIAAGVRRVLVAAGTGAGKTWTMSELAKIYLSKSMKVAVYTNRKMLLSQMSDAFTKFSVPHAVRAAGYFQDDDEACQIISLQTENVRTNKKAIQEIHPAHLVLCDEAHVLKGPSIKALLDKHIEDGAHVVGFTATPVDLEEWYDKLIVAGKPSELRACGAVVPCLHYGPDEPDLKAFKKLKAKAEGEDFTYAQAKMAMMTPTLFGRVGKWFETLNPDHKPTILFAPGVNESLWFAEQFVKKGIPAAHVDGDNIWVNGEFLPMKTDDQRRKSREKVLAMSKAGDVRVMCNRFVMREGIDAPWIRHVIGATMFGSVQSYIQSVGRGGRADRDPASIERWGPKDNFIFQDHGGHWHRLGSINADRHWDLSYTAGMIYGLRADRLRDKKEPEPVRCSKCGLIYFGTRCSICQTEPGVLRSRPVVTVDGELREMTGDIFVPRRVCKQPNGQSLWEKMYWRSRTKKGERSFRAAMALYAYENLGGYPDPEWKYMPKRAVDRFRLCTKVPMGWLVGCEGMPDNVINH
jgi:superfamily II DNA or RNA helicase